MSETIGKIKIIVLQVQKKCKLQKDKGIKLNKTKSFFNGIKFQFMEF